MPQITQLDNDPTPNNNDLLVTVDMAAGTTKNISRGQFFTGAPLPANTVDGQALADSAVTTGKINNGAVTAGKTAFGGNYSTSEVNTGFTWINGKPIFKKTVSLGSLPNSNLKNVNHGISSLDTVVDFYGTASDGAATIPLPHATTPLINVTDGFQVQVQVSSTQVQVRTGSNRSTATGYITIMYTKN